MTPDRTDTAGTHPAPLSPPFEVKVPLDRVWSASVGLEVDAVGADGVLRARLPVTERVCQPMGLVHGGIYSCIAEELASLGTGRQVVADGKFCVGQSNLTHFFRPGTLGDTLHAEARPIHRGRTTWVWDVDVRNDAGKVCARSMVTIAVREQESRP
jgi:1,4-dihydroxy-2-naphthoyl-CoA hydrolase